MISSINNMGGGFTPPSPAQISEKMFSAIDKNSDGAIDKDEISNLLANSTDGSSSVDDIMKMSDTDQDGSNTQSEFDNAREQMDPRKNGRIGSENDDDQSSIMKTLLDAMDNSRSSDIKQKLFNGADAIRFKLF